MWVFAASFADEEHSSWMKARELDLSEVGANYLTSLYFTVTTITTVGYGDISANNGIE